MPDWVVWIIAAAVLAAAESMSLDLMLIMAAGGAGAGALSAAVGAPVVVQIVVAIVATLALLVGVRPVAQRHLTAGTGVLTGSEALVGQHAVVLQAVDAADGRVRLNGAEWSARAFDERQVLPIGTRVRVLQISGATAVVLDEDAYLTTESTDEKSGDQS
jgi:membrane protein implicated in regulation of membrane protease activity